MNALNNSEVCVDSSVLVKLAIQEAARKLSLHLSGKRRAESQAERMRIFERYAEETAQALEELTGEKAEAIKKHIKAMVRSRQFPSVSAFLREAVDEKLRRTRQERLEAQVASYCAEDYADEDRDLVEFQAFDRDDE